MTELFCWQTSRRKLFYSEKTLVMGILNCTPDSFSDGGEFYSIDDALRRAETIIEEGADILDIGGESTRPKSARVSVKEEIRRTIPLIEKIAQRFDTPISIDTTKAEVAAAAIKAGAEIVNDVSGLRWDEKIGEVVSETKAGLILMHLRGEFETMHRQESVEDVLREVSDGFRRSIKKAERHNIKPEQIALDVGLGFGKTFEQNLELIGQLDFFCREFSDFPILVGSSRKSFVGKILGNAPVSERLHGSTASAVIAVYNGAKIVRVHDVKATVDAIRVAEALKTYKDRQNNADKS